MEPKFMFRKIMLVKLLLSLTSLLITTFVLYAQEESTYLSTYEVKITKDSEKGWLFSIDGTPTPIYGIVWSFTPIGENYTYNLWDQPKEFIKQTIDIDATMMKEIGVNVIRSFSTIPPEWVTYIYENYGIYTAINYLFGRYGLTVNNKWIPKTDYSDSATQEILVKESMDVINQYKDVPGVLMFMLGNENNYGLEWSSFEIENLPKEERHKAKAEYLYKVMGDAIRKANAITELPVGIVNGDILYIDLIAKYIPDLDYLATNVYRGKRTYQPENEYSSPFYEEIEKILDKPVILSEFGADAYNTVLKSEDQYHQAEYLRAQWEELFEYSYGKGKSQNTLGGFVFEWMDEWWKRGLDSHLNTQDTKGSWINGGYAYDFIPEQWNTHNNMNEEWLGIVSQSEEYYGGSGYYNKINKRIPRAAYYVLGDIWKDNMFEISNEEVSQMFSKKRNEGINIEDAVARANDIGMRERRKGLHSEWINFSLWLDGAMREHIGDGNDTLNYSYEQTARLISTIEPTPWFGARMQLRFQYEALDDVFQKSYSYSLLKGENKDSDEAKYRLPVEFYSSSFLLQTKYLDIEGFFHDGYRYTGGHTDWKAEGDFFGLLPESFYLDGLDRELSKAPFGLELTGHSYAEGLKIYTGPELFKGSRPSAMIKYYRELGGFRVGGIFEQELEVPEKEKEDNEKSGLVTDALRRKASLILGYTSPYLLNLMSISADAGILMSGEEKLEEDYVSSVDLSKHTDADLSKAQNISQISFMDTLAYKGKLDFKFNINPVINIWNEYTYAGLVASARASAIRNGGIIGDNGSANKQESIGGFGMYYGNWSLFGTYLWRQPLSQAINKTFVDPISGARTQYGRTQTTDPFVVFANRESLQAEISLNYDQTGSTYFYSFDNDDREDALFAMGLTYHHTFYNGRTDRLHFKNELGTYYSWPEGLIKVENLPAIKLRIVSNFLPKHKLIFSSIAAQTQTTARPNIDTNWNFSSKLTYLLHQFEISPAIDWNVFGPEDWHTEFGFRIPVQWKVYMAYHFNKIKILQKNSVLFAEVQGRYFDYTGISALDEDISIDAAKTALNPLGNLDDTYRISVTLGYSLRF